jgi:hypothetical protein
VLEAVPPAQRRADTPEAALALRWAIEDAWLNPLVLRRWTSFARQLDAAGCEQLLERINSLKLGPTRSMAVSDAQATEGWHLDTRGYVPHAVLMQRSARPIPQQASLPL